MGGTERFLRSNRRGRVQALIRINLTNKKLSIKYPELIKRKEKK